MLVFSILHTVQDSLNLNIIAIKFRTQTKSFSQSSRFASYVFINRPRQAVIMYTEVIRGQAARCPYSLAGLRCDDADAMRESMYGF